ncbi:MAG: hypothetical protein ACPGC5_05355 [Flavobacteriaceae bacterium]
MLQKSFTKILLNGLVFILLGCQAPKSKTTSDIFSLIPPESTGVLEIRQPEVFTPETLGDSWKVIEPVIQNALNSIEAIRQEGFQAGGLLCLSPLGKSDLAWTYIGKASDSIPVITGNRTYAGVAIQEHRNDPHVWYQAFINQVEIRSTSEISLEHCIRMQQKKEPNPLSKVLLPLQKASQPKAPLVWYYHASQLFDSHLQWNSPQLLPRSETHWVMYDGRMENNQISLDGITGTFDSIPSVYSLLKNLEAQSLKSLALIPQDFDELLVIPMENGPLLSTNFQQYARDKNLPLTDSQINEFNPFDEISLIRSKDQQAIILHRNGASETTLPFQWEEQKQFRKFRLGLVNLTPAMETFLELLGIDQSIRIGSLGEKAVCLATSESFLQKLLTEQINGRTLDNSTTFQKFTSQMSNRSSYLWVGATAALSSAETSTELLEQFPYVGLQAQIEDELVHLHASIAQKGAKETPQGLRTLGSIQLDAPLSGPLQWVKNHRSQGDDLLAYDQKNQLYLSSNTGSLFWKKQLSGAVIGPVSQVDLYKNKRLQLAFRTENKWVILDRNGKVVPPFDMKMPATDPIQPLAVFDYDNNREYRFLFAQGKTLKMYDRKGKIVRGFQAKKTSAPLLGAPQHFRIKNKDYIVFAQSNNELKILNRQGTDRIRVREKINFSQNKIYNYLNTFATTDLEGNLVQIDRKGQLNKSPLNLGADHSVDMTVKSLVSFSQNTLTIKGIPVTLPYGSYTPPEVFYLNNILYITLTNTETQKLYCFYSNGTPVQGFPAYGSGAAKMRYNSENKTIEVAVPGEGNSILIYDFSARP